MFGRSAQQQEQRLVPRLLEYFEQLVGRLRVHSLGQPDDDDLVFRLERFERQFADDFVGFLRTDIALLVVDLDGRVPRLFVEIAARIGHDFPPLRQETVAQRLFARASLGRVDRKNEVQVGMRQLRDLPARRALAARVAFPTVRAMYVLSVSDRQRQRSVSFLPGKELRVADPSGVDAPDKPLDGRPLAYDVFELQFCPDKSSLPKVSRG